MTISYLRSLEGSTIYSGLRICYSFFQELNCPSKAFLRYWHVSTYKYQVWHSVCCEPFKVFEQRVKLALQGVNGTCGSPHPPPDPLWNLDFLLLKIHGRGSEELWHVDSTVFSDQVIARWQVKSWNIKCQLRFRNSGCPSTTSFIQVSVPPAWQLRIVDHPKQKYSYADIWCSSRLDILVKVLFNQHPYLWAKLWFSPSEGPNPVQIIRSIECKWR